MSNRPRPVLLGYIRADVLGSSTPVERVEAQLLEFTEREEFSLGTLYVERGTAAAAFHSLMSELAHDDAGWGVLIPDLRHLTDGERQVLSGHDQGDRTRIVVASFIPLPRAAEPAPPARARSALPPPLGHEVPAGGAA